MSQTKDISNNLSLKYQMYTPSDCKDIGIRRSRFVGKIQLLCDNNSEIEL